MLEKKTNRTKDNIQKYSPQWMIKYHRWVKKNKPKEFTFLFICYTIKNSK